MEIREQLNSAFSTFLKNILGISLSVPESDITETWNKMQEFYLGSSEKIDVSNPHNVQGIINVQLEKLELL